MTHGFFIIMVGFHLFECSTKRQVRHIIKDEKPFHLLEESDICKCDLDGYESFIMLTKVKIKDRGKCNWLTKSLDLLKTSWFVCNVLCVLLNTSQSLISKLWCHLHMQSWILGYTYSGGTSFSTSISWSKCSANLSQVLEQVCGILRVKDTAVCNRSRSV